MMKSKVQKDLSFINMTHLTFVALLINLKHVRIIYLIKMWFTSQQDCFGGSFHFPDGKSHIGIMVKATILNEE